MSSSITDNSQPIGASPQVAKKDAGDSKASSPDKLLPPGADWIVVVLILAVFAGDFLLLEHNLLSWVCSQMSTLDCVFLGGCSLAIAYYMLRRPNPAGDSSRSSVVQRGRPQGSVKAMKQSSGPEGGTQREAGAGSGERPERSNAVVSKWNQQIDLAARQGDAAKAGQMLMDFEREGLASGHKPDAVSFNLVIRAYARKGDVRGAEKWLSRMEDRGIQATVCSYNTVLDACAKADNAEACESWLQRMLDKKVEANVISYATAIYARARRGEEVLAEKWLRSMIDAGITPDAVSYNSMIHACGVSGNAEGAARWIQEMQECGLEASVTTFTAVIDSCAKSGNVPGAEKWLEAMIAAKVQPNVVSFSAMIDACAKACDPTRAEYWHNRMIECNVRPNAHSYSAVINAWAKAGDAAMAEIWLGKSEEAGVANDVVVYSSVIDACGKVGDAERAMTVFHRMQANGIRPHIVAYAALARPYAYRGDWTAVEGIATEMGQNGIAVNEYFLYAQLLAYATARPRQGHRAELCFRNALTSGLKPNDHVVGALARAVGRARCSDLMCELCDGRAVPLPPQRREDRNSGNNARSRRGANQ